MRAIEIDMDPHLLSEETRWQRLLKLFRVARRERWTHCNRGFSFQLWWRDHYNFLIGHCVDVRQREVGLICKKRNPNIFSATYKSSNIKLTKSNFEKLTSVILHVEIIPRRHRCTVSLVLLNQRAYLSC